MRRIYLMGMSEDNKKLLLARARDAKFHSMEVPISRKLLDLIEEAEAEKAKKRGKKPPAERMKEAQAKAKAADRRAVTAERALRELRAEAEEARKRAERAEKGLRDAEARAEEARAAAERRAGRGTVEPRAAPDADPGPQSDGGLPEGGLERAIGLAPVEGLQGVGAIIRKEGEPPSGAPDGSLEPGAQASADAEAAREPGPDPVPDPVPEPGPDPESEPAPEIDAEPPKADPEPARADPALESNLTPAEIQTLLRAGRGVRSVAKQAEAPVDWVQRLAAPIEAERLGTVTQLLQCFQVRQRLGRSALPVGAAIVENLREKGVRFPDRVVEEGWSAARPGGREWRVQFAYESRGRTQRANWAFDPAARAPTPLNTTAQEIGYRAPDADGVPPGAASVAAAAIRPQVTARRSSAGKGIGVGGAKRDGGRTPAGRGKKPARKKPARNKPARKKPARKKPARKKPARKKPARKKPARNKPARKKPARNKPARSGRS